MKWEQAANLTWLYLDDNARLLGRLTPVADDPRIKWEASVMQGGYLRPHGGYFDEEIAKVAVEHFEQVTVVGGQHFEECPCQACTTMRYERRINHVTQADEDELARILRMEKAAGC